LLRVPSTRDRVVQQALRNVLQPIFDPGFHPSSYGYRPGRSCQQEVAKAERFLNRYRLEYVVDMDLSKCFDRLDHDLILQGVNQKVSDGSVLKLTVNAKKAHIASVQEGVAYLGFVIYPKYVAHQQKENQSLQRPGTATHSPQPRHECGSDDCAVEPRPKRMGELLQGSQL
jgi:hypothetical protein